MTLPMIIALAVTVLMIILIMVDKLPFGAPPLLALLLLVVFGVTDIKTAFGGFANPTIVMLASFMAIIAALQKTSFIVKFKQTIFNMASKGGFKAYVLLIIIVMLGLQPVRHRFHRLLCAGHRPAVHSATPSSCPRPGF